MSKRTSSDGSSTSSSAKSTSSNESSGKTASTSSTLVTLYDIDELSAHHCGYCNQNGSISIGMSSEQMQIDDYQSLIDRGWRRSGTYVYKPVMDKTCCPLYTIKCDALNLKLNRTQKRVLKKLSNYLLCGNIKNNSNSSSKLAVASDVKSSLSSSFVSYSSSSSSCHLSVINEKIKNFKALKIFDHFLENNYNKQANDVSSPNEILNLKRVKSKHRRLFRKLKKLKENSDVVFNDYSDIEKHLKRTPLAIFANELNLNRNIEDYIKTDKQSAVNKLEIKLVRSWPPSKEFQESSKEEHELYVKYQTKVHQDSPIECNWNQFQRFLCVSPLLFVSHPHGELTKMNDEKRAKLDESIAGDCHALGYGSFHQQYRLNGKLIAVGVTDILSKCVSSVYFFYDPDYHYLNLGTYSALREIALTRQLNKIDPNIKSYYLGFYAHSCKKMRYKGQFIPSYLVCPEVYTWHPIEYCRTLLEKAKYSRFAPQPIDKSTEKQLQPSTSTSDKTTSSLITKDENENMEIKNVKIRVKFHDSEMKIIKFTDFCEYLNPNFKPQFKRLIDGYCKLFGKKFSENVIIKF